MAGIVHFANFFRMMENTEHAFFRSLGFGIHGHENGTTTGWPRVNAACEFLRPLRFEEIVDIQLLVAEVRTRSIRYAFRFWKDDGGQRAEVARGSMASVCATVEKTTGKLTAVPIPEAVRTAIQAAPAKLLANLPTATLGKGATPG
jgi:acyl-CoA thioesterase FadM